MNSVTVLFPKETGVDRRKLQFTKVSVFSITRPEKILEIKKIITNFLEGENKSSEKLIITDATANVGGDTISFATYFKSVNAVEIDKTTFEMLNNNIDVYKRKNVKTFNNDYTTIMNKLKQDVVYIDSPWGGPKYKDARNITLDLSGIPLHNIVNNVDCKYVILKVPKNYNLISFLKLIRYEKVHFNHLRNMIIVCIKKVM